MSPKTWQRVPVTRLSFPSVCCHCGAPTRDTRTFLSDATVLERLIGRRFGYGGHYLKVPVPHCDACRRRARSATLRGTLVGTALSIVAVIGAAVVVGMLRVRDPAVTAAIGTSFFIGPIAGLLIARPRDPVELRRYRPKSGTVEIRFESEAFDQHLRSLP